MVVCCCCTGGSNLPDIFKESTVIVVPNGITFLTSSLSREGVCSAHENEARGGKVCPHPVMDQDDASAPSVRTQGPTSLPVTKIRNGRQAKKAWRFLTSFLS